MGGDAVIVREHRTRVSLVSSSTETGGRKGGEGRPGDARSPGATQGILRARLLVRMRTLPRGKKDSGRKG